MTNRTAMRSRSTVLAAAFLTGSLGAAGVALAEEPTTAELLEQIEQLKAQVEKKQVAEASASKADALARVLDEAESPAYTQVSSPFLAGWDGKFLLKSEDGAFVLEPNFQLQIRNVTNFYGEGDDDFEEVEQGWEMRRVKIGFKGNAFTKALKYDIKYSFDRNEGDAGLENAFITYAPTGEDAIRGIDGLGFRVGQYKNPLFREESTSSSRQLAADRSVVNETLGGGVTDFTQGVALFYNPDEGNFYSEIAYTDGPNSDNTNYRDQDSDYAFYYRGDIKLFGDWETQRDFTALGTDTDSAFLGFGAEYAGAGDESLILLTIDGSYETAGGFSVYGAWLGNIADDGDDEIFNHGFLVQAAQLIPGVSDTGELEIFGRFGMVLADEDITIANGDTEDNFFEVTGGVNYYLEGHKAKVTLDVNYITDNALVGSGLGYQENGTDEITIRGQFQLLF